jgi:alkylation response protein AidB-like acyl-CoA dehydrogenase
MAATYVESVEGVARIAGERAAATDAGAFPIEVVEAMARSGLLGLVSDRDVGGSGADLAAAATVVEQLSRECASSAMVACMHYCATVVVEAHGSKALRSEIAQSRHLTTLAFSEAGSRSHFWAPVGVAELDGERVHLDGRKSWVTSATHADSYVWSSKPLSGSGASTLWLVPRTTPGIHVAEESFDGLGLRGNDSRPVRAERALVPRDAMLGTDGSGFDLMMGVVLPWFSVLASAVNVGLMESAVRRTAAHVQAAQLQHLGSTIADLPTVRAYIARMRIHTDQSRALLQDTIAALGARREDASLRVLECKASSGELVTQVADLAMRVCGGAAFRKEAGIERVFRDARASIVMAPTTDLLYDLIGKAVCGQPLF